MLWAAAAFNLVIGLPGLLRPGASLEGRLVAVLVAGFGVLYAMVATDPPRFSPVLWAGVFGKLGVIALMAPAVAKGQAPKATGVLLAGDALFTAAFLYLLLGGG
jgi:cobalamin biosynthesis protein CobD/CbiB